MPVPTETGAAFRVRVPAVLVRAADSPTRIEARLGSGGVGSAPASYTLKDDVGTTVYTTTSVTVASGVYSVTVPAASLPTTLGFGATYREVWTATVGGVVQTWTRPAVLARYPLHCPVTQADLEDGYPDLAATLATSDGDFDRFIDQAWADVIQALLSAGKWPEEIVDVDALHVPVRELALAKVFEYAAIAQGNSASADRYEARATRHRGAYKSAMAEVKTRRDVDQDGVADSEDRDSAAAIIQRGSAARFSYSTHGGSPFLGSRGRVL